MTNRRQQRVLFPGEPLRGLASLLLTLCLLTTVALVNGEAQTSSQLIQVTNLQQVQADIAAKALSYRGSPYRYAGTTSAGFDCSGLVWRVYKEVTGKSIPRTATTQAAFGTAVSRSALQAGDILFFNTTGNGISHSGIYDGKGGVIHAASAGPQLGVILSQLSENYYSSRFVTARRILTSGSSTGTETPAAPAQGDWAQIAGKWRGDKGLKQVTLQADGTGLAVIDNDENTVMRLRIVSGQEPGTIRIEQAEPNRPEFYTGILNLALARQLAQQARPMAWIFRIENRNRLLRGIKETTYFNALDGKIQSVDNSYSRSAQWSKELF